MPRSRPRALPFTALLALGVAAPNAQARERVDLLLRDVTVVDVVDGRLLPDRDIAVRDGRILAIEAHRTRPGYRAATTVDGNDRYVIPGLWDMHVHFGGGDALIEENANLLPLYVAHGITAVRDAAGDLSASVFQWRDDVAAGTRLGPRIFTSGPKIEGIGSIWPGDQEVADDAGIDAALDRLQAWNVDFVKITDNALSPPLFMHALAKAKARGMTTSAHIPMVVPVLEASAAGLGSIEHIAYAWKAGAPDEAGLSAKVASGALTAAQAWDTVQASFDPAGALPAYRRLAAHGTAVTPTLNGSRVVAYLDRDDHKRDSYLQYIGPGLQATYAWRVERAGKDDAAAIARRHARYERSAAILPLLQQAGVTVLAGTDAGFLNSFNYPGIGLHDELALFVHHGLTPLQALQAATVNGARFLKQDAENGSVAAGKRANLVLLDANPLQDIAATRRIRAVVLEGRVYERAALDAMLEQARIAVSRQRDVAAPPH
ncbi:amidohydrolase [Lysobacter daejeonensis GH1-9]|uniref:Amidohydrolase n=1 Tax=Lysobacter daejeonensis GH1-9 TaxID=1385517 RepID=A0A0A0F1N4_9GAMM|nr:amidohydrolase family protein [Lysobacter daejeonensis]KGM55292.1 amidohydrolase [Lysobacter daejeonensis GH1-9]